MDNGQHSQVNFNRLFLIVLTLALVWGVAPNPAMAQAQAEAQAQAQAESPEEPKPEKLFKSEAEIQITLKAPWNDIIRNKKNQNPYPATMEFVDEQGQPVSIPLTVERRGLTRQTICKHPPIKLRFNPEDVKDTIFRGQKSLKMVTHCDVGERWTRYYIKEFVIYQIYRHITDLSFRARPLSVTYVESESDSSQKPRFAFLIEDDSDVAKRNNIEKLDTPEIQPNQLQAEQATRLALFEYIISNVDFDQTGGPKSDGCCHNSRLFGLDPQADILPVPYDFDGSGLVNSHYAAPNEFLPIKKVTQRLFRGFCVHNPSLEPVRQEFFAKEQEIYTIVRDQTLLSEPAEEAMLDFLQDSFAILHDEEKFNKLIIQKCRK
jgi:hypothetical protein